MLHKYKMQFSWKSLLNAVDGLTVIQTVFSGKLALIQPSLAMFDL